MDQNDDRYDSWEDVKYGIMIWALKNYRFTVLPCKILEFPWPCDVRKDKQDLVFRTHRGQSMRVQNVLYTDYMVSFVMLFHCYRRGWWKRNSVSSHLPEAVISLGLSCWHWPPPPRTPHRIPRWTIEILAFNISVKHASPPSNALTSKDDRWWVHSTNMGHSCSKISIFFWRPCTKNILDTGTLKSVWTNTTLNCGLPLKKALENLRELSPPHREKHHPSKHWILKKNIREFTHSEYNYYSI